MKKQNKKKLELQLQTAIEAVLLKQDSGAASKSKKTIRQASKAIVKKFNKAVKSVKEKKDAGKQKKIKSKKKNSVGKSQLKNISGETARVKRSYTREAPITQGEIPPAVISAEGGNPGTENI